MPAIATSFKFQNVLMLYCGKPWSCSIKQIINNKCHISITNMLIDNQMQRKSQKHKNKRNWS